MAVQDTFQINPGPAELPEAEIIEIAERPGGKQCLVLQASIGGQPRKFVLALDALEGHGLSGPAAVAELRAIRELLSTDLQTLLRVLAEFAGPLQNIADRLTRLPKAESG